MEALPRVTVLMPVYNAEKHIEEAVASILDQTFTDFELLIMDDGSTDQTLALLGQFTDPRIRIVSNPGNLGIVYTLNRGVALAKGVFIARMDADDVAHPDRLMKQEAYLSGQPDVAICGCGIVAFFENGRRHRVYYSLKYDTLKAESLFNSPFPHPGVMVKKAILNAYPYRTEALHVEDYDLWSRILKDHSGANLPYFLLDYRVSADNVTAMADRRVDERKKVIAAIHAANLDHLGYAVDPDTLNLHYQLSWTTSIRQLDFNQYGMERINRHASQLLGSVRISRFCSVYSISRVLGKIYLKLVMYNFRRMGNKNRWLAITASWFWIGIFDFAVLRLKYFLGR